jgi:hypothetical protein
MPSQINLLTLLLEELMGLSAAVLAPIAIVMLATGLCLLLWGRHLHRAVLVLLTFPVGVVAGVLLADQFHVARPVGVLAAVVVLAALMILLARVVWALLAGLWLGGIVACLVTMVMLGAAVGAAVGAAGPDPLRGKALFQSIWASAGMTILCVFAAAALAGFVLCLLLPRATVIAITSLMGASFFARGLGLFALVLAPNLLVALAVEIWIGIGVFLCSLVLGIVYQSIMEVRAKRAEAQHRSIQAEAQRRGDGRETARVRA